MTNLDLVDVEPIRDAYLRSGLSLSDVARSCGWLKVEGSSRRPDTTRVARALGLTDRPRGDGSRTRNSRIAYGRAVVLVRAIGCDPIDVGV